MVRYMKCPRCELNYIDAERQEYCDICLKEMKGIPSDLDEIEEEEERLPTELCPICGENMMRPGDKMCEECRNKSVYDEDDVDSEEDDEWREYLDDDTDADLDSEIGEIDEAFDDEFETEEDVIEEMYEDEEEDLEYVTGDEVYLLAGDDDDEEDVDDDF